MLTIGASSRTAVHFILFLFLNLLLLSSFCAVQALPTHRHAPSMHLSRRLRLPQARRAAAEQSVAPAVPEYSSSQHYLHRRRLRAGRVSSSPRTAVADGQHIHELDARHMPAQLTTVKHILLSRRRHHYDDDEGGEQEDDKDEDEESESGRGRGSEKGKGKQKGKDANGYDDGSWRGDEGDYGGNSSDSWQDKKGKVKSVKSSSSSKKHAEEDDEEEEAMDEDDEEEAFTPKVKVKAVKGTRTGSDPGDDSEDLDAEKGSMVSDDADTTTAKPNPKVKAVKSSKGTGDEPTATEDEDEDEPSSTASSTKKARSSATPARSGASSSGASGTDCDTLSAIYEDMGGADWVAQDGWGSKDSSGCCSAYGVSCNSEGRVTALDLENNGISGALSAHLFDLAALYRL